MRWLLVLSAWLLAATPAAAQRWQWQDGAEEGVIKAKLDYPVGNPDAIARLTWASLRLGAAREERCRQVGCLILINGTTSYRLEGFFVRPVAPKSETDWGSNQLDRSLLPNEAAIRFKLPDKRFCAWPVRLIFRHRKTKAAVHVETNANICAAPGQDTLLKVRLVTPDVRVEGS